jgi:hypothetical protein
LHSGTGAPTSRNVYHIKRRHTSHTTLSKISIFWDTTPCSGLAFNRRFGITCCPHLRSRSSQAKNQHGAGITALMMGITRSSETTVDFQWATRRHSAQLNCRSSTTFVSDSGFTQRTPTALQRLRSLHQLANTGTGAHAEQRSLCAGLHGIQGKLVPGCVANVDANQSVISNKLRGPWSASELYRLIDRHLSTKFSVNFCG